MSTVVTPGRGAGRARRGQRAPCALARRSSSLGIAAGPRRLGLPARAGPRRHQHAQPHDVGPVHHHVHVLRGALGRRPDRRLRRPALRRRAPQADRPHRRARGDRGGHDRRAAPAPRHRPPGPRLAPAPLPALHVAADLGPHHRHGLLPHLGDLRVGVHARRPRARAAAGSRSAPARRSRTRGATSGSRACWPRRPAGGGPAALDHGLDLRPADRARLLVLGDHGAAVHHLGARLGHRAHDPARAHRAAHRQGRSRTTSSRYLGGCWRCSSRSRASWCSPRCSPPRTRGGLRGGPGPAAAHGPLRRLLLVRGRGRPG